MTLTVLDRDEIRVDGHVDGERIWIDGDQLEPATGWTHKPEGLCRGPVCVPVRHPIGDGHGRVDLAAVARALGKQLVLDGSGPVVAIADDPMGRGETRNLHELSLPDVDGRLVDLSGTAGRKVLLLAWASW